MSPLVCIATIFALTACGTNIYQEFDSEDPAEAASVAMDEGKADKAISILESAIAKEPMNYELSSLMASAKAQKAGVDTMDFALNMASSGGAGDIVGLFSVVPVASAENLTLLQEAVDLLEAIPSEHQISADSFKLSMFYTSLLTLRTKTFDTDGDGNLSIEELASLDEASAIQILQDLASAEGVINGYTPDDGTQEAAHEISSIAAAIEAQDGTTDSEKLRNFLGS